MTLLFLLNSRLPALLTAALLREDSAAKGKKKETDTVGERILNHGI